MTAPHSLCDERAEGDRQALPAAANLRRHCRRRPMRRLSAPDTPPHEQRGNTPRISATSPKDNERDILSSGNWKLAVCSMNFLVTFYCLYIVVIPSLAKPVAWACQLSTANKHLPRQQTYRLHRSRAGLSSPDLALQTGPVLARVSRLHPG